jgi:hypothetical protein
MCRRRRDLQWPTSQNHLEMIRAPGIFRRFFLSMESGSVFRKDPSNHPSLPASQAVIIVPSRRRISPRQVFMLLSLIPLLNDVSSWPFGPLLGCQNPSRKFRHTADPMRRHVSCGQLPSGRQSGSCSSLVNIRRLSVLVLLPKFLPRGLLGFDER